MPRILAGRGDSFDFTVIALFVVAFLVFVGLAFGLTRAARQNRAEGVVYGITDRRVLILGESASPRDLSPFPPDTWHIEPDADGTGSLIFGHETSGYDIDARERIGLYGISDVARVAALAREAWFAAHPTA
jgi:hypothetical protein